MTDYWYQRLWHNWMIPKVHSMSFCWDINLHYRKINIQVIMRAVVSCSDFENCRHYVIMRTNSPCTLQGKIFLKFLYLVLQWGQKMHVIEKIIGYIMIYEWGILLWELSRLCSLHYSSLINLLYKKKIKSISAKNNCLYIWW